MIHKVIDTVPAGESSEHWWAGPSYGAGLVSKRTALVSQISKRHRVEVAAPGALYWNI